MFSYLPKTAAIVAATVTPLLLASAASASQGDCGKCLPPSITKEVTSVSHRGYLVNVGKRTIWVSQAMQGVTPPSPQATSASAPARDYLVTQGKRAVLASTLSVPAPNATSPKSPCMENRFVTEGKAVRWETGCAMQGTARQMGCCVGQ